MSMLADRKTAPKWVLNPVASEWSKDQNKLGQKMLEKMGWSVGKGLGAKEQGRLEAIRISYKGDTRGLGAGRRKEQEDWLQQQQSFQSLLENLNGDTDKSVKINSLEEKSKTTRTKIHYHKFARGKDISRYSEKDLSCILGSGFVPFKIPEAAESVSTPSADDACDNLDLSDEESMDRGRSRSGRVLKPSTKLAEASREPILPVQGEVGRRKGREVKAEADRSPSPKKKKTKKKRKEEEESAEIESDLPSKPGPSEVSIITPVTDHLHSRSGREYKPSAKVAANMEEQSTSSSIKKNSRTSDENHVKIKNSSGSSSGPTKAKKQKISKDGEEFGSVSSPKSPKKESKEDLDDSGTSKAVKNERKKRKAKNASERSDEAPADQFDSKEVEGEEAKPRKRAKRKPMDAAEVENQRKKKTAQEIADESALEPESSTSRPRSERVKSRKGGEMGNGASDDTKVRGKEPKRKGKKGMSPQEQDEREEPTQGLKKKARKQTEGALENNEAGELPSKRKQKKRRNIDQPENPADENTAKFKVRKPIVKLNREDSTESQDTVASKRTDSEEAAEELCSINSQSSLISEMIGTVSPLKVCQQPEELKRYAILLSDSDD